MNISVVVPVYNVEEYLVKCVTSIVNQTIKVKKIILVDDGSTDRSGIICDMLAKKYNNIFVIHQKNGGLSAARNTGLRHVKTPWVTFVDSDDYIDSNMYESMMKYALKDVDIISSNIYNFKFDLDDREEWFYWDKKELMYEFLLYNKITPAAWNKIYKTKLFDNIKYPKGRVIEDLSIIYKLYHKANKVVHVNRDFYHYIVRRGSITFPKNVEGIIKHRKDLIIAREEQMKFYKKYYPDLYIYAKITYLHSLLDMINICFINNYNKNKKELNKYLDILKTNKATVFKSSITSRIIKFEFSFMIFSYPIYKFYKQTYYKIKKRRKKLWI